ncbi:MAG: Membrane-bound lytic murein transglycosylase A precursor (EC [uncultured Thiotrichaceae bacterium]|uniref:peptidoglycan lytic exotransglycosylase n=1 Tax=uncultured Thiotrichaceae bacterium TaxID=298394 RepID=A0A6S6TRB3_9GAMM|nr:MAG: Membrane-bound lytic murein transglycosylase A precursor (EC [uncultured Thiotrichaceae bacterium]
MSKKPRVSPLFAALFCVSTFASMNVNANSFMSEMSYSRYTATESQQAIRNDFSDKGVHSCAKQKKNNLRVKCVQSRSGFYSVFIALSRYVSKHSRYKLASTRSVLLGSELAGTFKLAKSMMNQGGYVADYFDLKNVSTSANGKTRITGYYTPILQASHHKDSVYRVPVYKAPKSHYQRTLTRAQIDSGQLGNKGLEIAWVKDPVEFFFMQIQGSAILEFQDGSQRALRFDADNGIDFVSIPRYMKQVGIISNPSNRVAKQWLSDNPHRQAAMMAVNKRYVFFKEVAVNQLTTSTMTKPLAWHTVAVDSRFIPHGSILLAKIPVIDQASGVKTGFAWRYLLAQDSGNAIKGDSHIDLYLGYGSKARQLTNAVTQYTEVYVLKPKAEKLVMK